MARLSLNCSCGWNFFIPGTTPGHEVTCPSCNQNVRIPGRKPGQATPQSAGEIALEVNRRQSRIKMIIGAAVAGFFMMGGKSSPEEESGTSKGRDPGLTGLDSLGTNGTRGSGRKPPVEP